MRNLAELVARAQPGRSVNEICDAAGLSRNRLGYYLKPGSKVTRMPTAQTVNAIATALQCEPSAVIAAFLADLYSDGSTSEPAADEAMLVSAYRSLRRTSQQAVLRLVQELAEPD